jgi:hypothetical protein
MALPQRPPTRKRDRALAERLRDMRHKWKETQRQFYRHFSVAFKTYCGWERSGVPRGPTSLMVKLVLVRLNTLHYEHYRRPRDPAKEREREHRKERYLARHKGAADKKQEDVGNK